MSWIRTIPPDEASGLLREEYDRAMKRAGRIANVLRISSLNPQALKHWTELYISLMFAPSPLSRAEREMIAVVTSQVNHCEY